ncbi:porin family protein [Neolewinella agarilytica]|uniref:Outer membrane protein beta-barrel domain-containing protein n=1 Tax=Neolewinella agarilytica TaxID=478744 RepID=A0A1H8Z2D2_9BACT|nr:porin family protein [Neolewinella agarilytica]SEP58580.1 Outer membrane protein beta-barrel domain-containing protein [Neolewinella agarilytica]
MRSYLLFAIAFSCFISSLSAQHFGLRVGANATDATFDLDSREIETEGETNLMLGIFVDLPLVTDLISIQPEINYLNRGYSTNFDVGALSFSRTLAYIDLGGIVKLNLGADDGLGFYLGAGPMYSYAVSGTVTEVGGERDVDFDGDRLNRGELQFAGVAGLTYNFGLRFFVEGRYNGSLSDQSDLDNSEIRQRSIGINGGIMIPLGN